MMLRLCGDKASGEDDGRGGGGGSLHDDGV